MQAPEQHPWATAGRGRGGEYAWFDKRSEIANAPGKHLPHLRQPGAIYFTTFRTADSIPAPVMARWNEQRVDWLLKHPEPHDEAVRAEYHRRFTARMHRFLDDCLGECPFKRREARDLLEQVMTSGETHLERYKLDEYVIMPNHVHVLVSPNDAVELTAVTLAWKRASSHAVNRLIGRSGQLWQHESWDHAVRSPEHLEHFQRYIRANPNRLPSVR